MKRGLKVLCIVLGVILVLVLTVLIGVSPIAKHVIEKNSKQWVGRQINIEKLSINLLNGKLRADNIVMFEANDSSRFASIDTLYLNVAIYKLISKEVKLQEGDIVKPYAVLLQDGDKFNFSDMFASDTTEVQDTTKSEMTWAIDLNKLSIKDGNVVYTDLELDNTIDLRAISLYVPSLRFGKGTTEAGLNLLLEQGSIYSKLDLDQENNTYLLSLKLEKIGIELIKPYLRSSFNVGDFNGDLNTELQLQGSLDHLMEFTANGVLALNDVLITTDKNEPVVKCQAINANLQEFNMSNMNLRLSSLVIDNLESAFILQNSGNNFSSFLKSSADTTHVESQPVDSTEEESSFALLIDTIRLENSAFTFEDLTLKQPFRYPISKISVTANNFTLDGENNVRGHLNLGKSGTAFFRWQGSLESMANMQLMLGLKSVSAAEFSPYCIEYTGYPITDGTISFEDETKITNNMLSSKNSIDIYKLAVAPKERGVKAKVNIPLRAGVYVLTDRKGNIKFNIPVAGNITDPEFKYGKIIWQTISNLLVKVTLSPATFIADALGLTGGVTDKVVISPLATGFTSAQYTEFAQVGKIYESKPDLSITLKQYVDTAYMYRQLALVLVKRDFYNQSHADDITRLNDFAMEQINAISNTNSAFQAYVAERMQTAGLSQTGTIQQQCEQLITPEQIRQQSGALLDFRNHILNMHMTESLHIPQSQITIVNANDSLPTNKSAYYQISYSIQDSAIDAEQTTETDTTAQE